MVMLRTNKLPLFGGILWLALLALPAEAQVSRNTQIGAIQFNTNEVMSNDDIYWPHTWNRSTSTFYGSSANRDDFSEMMENVGIIVGTKRSWTDPVGNNWPIQVAQVAHNKFSDIKNVTAPVKGAFKRIYRNPPPTKELDGQNWTQLFERTDPVDQSIPSDVMITAKVNLWPQHGMNMQLERWAYLFAGEQHDDYVLLEYVLTNTGTEPRQDVYLGFTAQPTGQAHYPGDIWGNYYGSTFKEYAAGNRSADSLRLWYAWNANRIHELPKEDTRARPDGQWGQFEKPQAFGFAVIHADKSASDESDDPSQPRKAGWSERELSPNLNEHSQQTVYDFMAQPWLPNKGDGEYAMYDPTNRYRMLMPNANIESLKPNLEQEKSGFVSFGPYNLGPGENVRIVLAYVGGTIPQRLAIDAGRAYKNGATAQFALVPLPANRNLTTETGHQIVRDGNIYDLKGNLIASAGQTLTTEQKNRILDISKDLVFYTASRAVRTWNSGNVKKGTGKFNIDYAPAAPSLVGTSEGDQIRLKWTDNTQDASRGGAPVKWRIYREYKRPPSLNAPHDTTFLFLAELPASQTEYIDKDVVRGEQYYYYVAAVNAKGVESSPFQNRTGTSATKSDEQLVPRSPANTGNWQDEVVVVPNPFHIQGTKKYSDRRLNFLNLPPYSRIHIFTLTGDRVQTIDHDVNAGDEDWQRQDTFNTMEIVSGVYLYVVEKLDGPGGKSTGEKAVGKFVVIK